MDEQLEQLEFAVRWAASRNTRVIAFGVCRFAAKDCQVIGEFASLDEARDAARALGLGPLGRKPIIVALTPEGWACELEQVGPR